MIIYIFVFVSSFWGKLRNTFYGIIHCRLHLTQKRGWFANFTHFEFWIIKVTNRYFFQQKVTNKLIFFPATNLQINTFSCEKDINWNLFVQIVTFPHKKVTVHNLFEFNFFQLFWIATKLQMTSLLFLYHILFCYHKFCPWLILKLNNYIGNRLGFVW